MYLLLSFSPPFYACFSSSVFSVWQMFPLFIPFLSLRLLFLACAADCTSSPMFLIFRSFPSVSSLSVLCSPFPLLPWLLTRTPTSCSIRFLVRTAYVAALQSLLCTHSGVASPLACPCTHVPLSCLPLSCTCVGLADLQVWGCIPKYKSFILAQLPSSSQTCI